MKRFVLDNSVCMSWFFADESNDYTISILDALCDHNALVPSIWGLEVANVLLTGQRRGRCSEAECSRFINLLAALPISTDYRTSDLAQRDIYHLALQYRLTAYDAAYLELAIREGIPLATQDKSLLQAALQSGVKLFNS